MLGDVTAVIFASTIGQFVRLSEKNPLNATYRPSRMLRWRAHAHSERAGSFNDSAQLPHVTLLQAVSGGAIISPVRLGMAYHPVANLYCHIYADLLQH